MRAGSHELVDIEACPILAPALAEAPRVAAHLAAILTRSGKPIDIAMTATGAGLDVTVKGHGPLGGAEREAAVAFAARADRPASRTITK